MNPANGDHLGVLFWGDRPTDASKPKHRQRRLAAIPLPPFGGMWNHHPARAHHDPLVETTGRLREIAAKWSTTEMLRNLEKGTLRAAVDGVEIVRYTHPKAGCSDPETRIVPGPVGMFRHGKGASEYKDIYLEANPKDDKLLTVR